jgi:hypothetical protein
MKLTFHAKGDLLVPVPGIPIPHGGGVVPQYVGRTMVTKPGEGFAFPAVADPHEAESSSKEGRRLAKLCVRDAALWPADEATAKALGVAFVKLELKDGEHVAASGKKGSA